MEFNENQFLKTEKTDAKQESPENPIEQRIREQTAMAEKLKETKPYTRLTGYKIYEDPHRFALEDIERLSPEVKEYVKPAMIFLNHPLLTDTISQKVLNTKRVRIREKLEGKNRKEGSVSGILRRQDRAFYDSNKLNSSESSGVLYLTALSIEYGIFPEDLIARLKERGIPERIEELRKDLDGEDTDQPFTARRYKSEMNTKEKLAVVEKTQKLIEDVLMEIFQRSPKNENES